MTALGEAVTHLPWLAPCADSLVALARGAATWSALRTDPGCLLLILRCAPTTGAPAAFTPGLLRDAQLLEGAVRHLDQAGAVAWEHPAIQPVYQSALRYAAWAERLAHRSGKVAPEYAWMAGLLAPLGWLAVSALDAEAVHRCRTDPAHADQPGATQRHHWGLDQTAIARRLARRWRLPTWFAATIGHLALPIDTALALGVDAQLFRIVQLAVSLVQHEQAGLGLEVGCRAAENSAALGLTTDAIDSSRSEVLVPDSQLATKSARLSSLPLLRDLLAVAAENRRLTDAPILERLERDSDHLQRALTDQRASEAGRLLTNKLSTLAEFAAGAGHEINNPLAVISGQAQYLLGHLQADDQRLSADSAAPMEHSAAPAVLDLPAASTQRCLQTIMGQAQRIHEILNQLMQFARPSRPQKRLLDLGSLFREVTLELGALAEQRRVRLVCPDLDPPLHVLADARQLHMAVACLLRNAIEATPTEGWAGIRATTLGPDQLAIVVEDSGPGPTAQQREHIFDPFYSGRPAGRGRGLGLPTAWRLAREHGGDVYLDEQTEGPTRFILRLPRDPAWDAGSANATGTAPMNRVVPGLGENPALAG